MKYQSRTVAVAVLLCLSACLSARGQGQPMATPAELQQMYDARQYNICLQQIARVIGQKNKAVAGVDRDKLQLLRGECFVRLQDKQHARAAFLAAQVSEDPKTALTARANVLIIEKSNFPNFVTKAQSINIVEPATRQLAMLALFERELQTQRPAIEQATNAQTLGPIYDALPKLKDLAALEITGSGEDKEIRPLLENIGGRARSIMGAALSPLDAQIATIEARAEEPAVVGLVAGGAWWTTAGRRGLDTPDRQALESVLDTASRIYNTAVQGRVTSRALNGNPSLWEALASDAERVVARARNVLERE